jgi:hypothetical protein
VRHARRPGATPGSAMTAAVSPWTCPCCRTPVSSAFCPDCGERPITPPDFTLSGLLAQALKAVGSIDGRLLRTLRALIGRPGALTEAYAQGQRKPWVGPFQLLLIANVFFFAMQSITHTKIFSSSLDSHLYRQDWSVLAQQLVAQRLAASHTTLERYAPLFDQAVVLNAKSLVVLMVLPFVPLLPLVFRRSRRPFGVHVAFALHLYAFMLLLFCVSLAIEAGDRWLLSGAGLESARVDNLLTAFNLTLCAGYVFIATGRVYASRGVPRMLQALTLSVAVGAILLGYRFAIFLVTLYAT